MWFALWLIISNAFAGDPEQDALAKSKYEEGRVAFDGADYLRAAILFQEAYDLSGRPQLLFNLAVALDRYGDREAAIATLQQYRPLAPENVRASVDQRIAQIQEAYATQGSRTAVLRPEPEVVAPTPEVVTDPTSVVEAPPVVQPAPAPIELARRGDVKGGVYVASTMSEVYTAFRVIERSLLPRIENPEDLASMSVFLVPLGQHIDFEEIGRGRLARVDTDAVLAFFMAGLGEHKPLSTLSRDVVAAWRAGEFEPDSSAVAAGSAIHVGGYLVTEFEFHQEPDGSYVPLAEVNQSRIFFSSVLNPFAGQNRFSLLVEWNPVPEEVIHQIDEIELPNGDALAPIVEEIEGLIPFEQAFSRVERVGGSPVDLTFGQFRVPFGLWSDYSSHRNFTTVKNNALVHGFALKKIELGGLATTHLGPVDVDVAVVHGRLGRTAPLDRADHDSSFDGVARVRFQTSGVELGANAYFVGFRPNDAAVGAYWALTPGPFSVSGEVVWQNNPDADRLYDGATESLSSIGAYGQVEAALAPRWRVYGLYEGWRLSADQEAFGTAGKMFHGMRFIPHQQVRWMVLEYGYMFHEGFDEGNTHLSSQLELTF